MSVILSVKIASHFSCALKRLPSTIPLTLSHSSRASAAFPVTASRICLYLRSVLGMADDKRNHHLPVVRSFTIADATSERLRPPGSKRRKTRALSLSISESSQVDIKLQRSLVRAFFFTGTCPALPMPSVPWKAMCSLLYPAGVLHLLCFMGSGQGGYPSAYGVQGMRVRTSS